MDEMMHLSYLYIKDFAVLKNVGFTFDNHFVFTMTEGVLQIKRDIALPERFWGNGIYSMSAIVGNNGSGKTTALRLIKRLVIDGAPREAGVKVLMVYEQNGELYVFNPTDIKVEAERDIRILNIQNIRKINTLYYSGHFRAYEGSEDMELAGSYEASDGWLLVKDLQDYSNVDTLHLSEPLYNHLQAYNAQNNYRICDVLMLEGLDRLLTSINLPKYVIFSPNRGGWNAIKLDRTGDYELPGEKWTSRYIREQALERIIYYDIINLIAERKGEVGELKDFLQAWMRSSKDDGAINTLGQLLDKIKLTDASQASLNSLLYVMDKLSTLSEFDENSGTFYIHVKKGADKLKALMEEIMKSHFFLTAKFFDIYFAHQLGEGTFLSSGEQELLNLLSRLYYGITVMPQKFGNKESCRLLLLDEAEIGFHPDWQRRYVKILTEFMQYMKVKAGVDFQIVITSHSPIILSDIPVSCVNFLRKRGNTTLVSDEKQTFGENIFNLYRRAFFMEDGLIGEFAQQKIRQWAKDVEENLFSEELEKSISLIGDERIKDYLMREIAGRNIDAEIAYHEEKIKELREAKENRHE